MKNLDELKAELKAANAKMDGIANKVMDAPDYRVGTLGDNAAWNAAFDERERAYNEYIKAAYAKA